MYATAVFDPTPLVILAAVGGVVVLVIVIGVVSQMQARAGMQARLKQSAARSEEALDLARRNADNMERLLLLTEQSVRNQEEMVRLLRERAGGDAQPPERAGVRHAPQHP